MIVSKVYPNQSREIADKVKKMTLEDIQEEMREIRRIDDMISSLDPEMRRLGAILMVEKFPESKLGSVNQSQSEIWARQYMAFYSYNLGIQTAKLYEKEKKQSI